MNLIPNENWGITRNNVGDCAVDLRCLNAIIFLINNISCLIREETMKDNPYGFAYYSRRDHQIVNEIVEGLKTYGIKVWLDVENLLLVSNGSSKSEKF